ncbi:peptidoglycan-binding domain-containing protein [Microbacterium trichothecenolyticum]|uniref:peptidoglycan-binding domain-containing protein n=1 Tax=Microbacterium trichothecenolyticum TaxID=69370 RepID=UPI0027D90D26|nr:hypothetical protein [Microbacterium trichothecenolyticum]
MIAAVVVLAVMMGAAFVAGGLVRSPTSDALQSADIRLPVRVNVEERVVDAGFSVPAALTPAATAGVFVSGASVQASDQAPTANAAVSQSATPATSEKSLPKAERTLLSKVVVGSGDRVRFGDLVAEVSGRPVFAIPPTVPLYRDLIVGAEGTDVRSLQQFLIDRDFYGVRVTGELDSGTIAALTRMYAAVEYELPFVADGQRGLAWREFVVTPADDLPVVQSAPVGTLLSPEVPVMTLQTTPATLTAQFTKAQRDRIESGRTVGVSIAGAAPIASSVLRVGDLVTDAGSGASGYPISVAVPDGAVVDAATPIRLSNVDQPPPGTAVPAVAVYQEGGSAYVVLAPPAAEDGGTLPPRETVAVTVLTQSDGWVAIEADERLIPGTALLVEP